MVEMKNQQIQTETIQPMEQTGNMTQQEVVYTNEDCLQSIYLLISNSVTIPCSVFIMNVFYTNSQSVE